MADLRTNLAGIKSPNPFWLASAPPPKFSGGHLRRGRVAIRRIFLLATFIGVFGRYGRHDALQEDQGPDAGLSDTLVIKAVFFLVATFGCF